MYSITSNGVSIAINVNLYCCLCVPDHSAAGRNLSAGYWHRPSTTCPWWAKALLLVFPHSSLYTHWSVDLLMLDRLYFPPVTPSHLLFTFLLVVPQSFTRTFCLWLTAWPASRCRHRCGNSFRWCTKSSSRTVLTISQVCVHRAAKFGVVNGALSTTSGVFYLLPLTSCVFFRYDASSPQLHHRRHGHSDVWHQVPGDHL